MSLERHTGSSPLAYKVKADRQPTKCSHPVNNEKQVPHFSVKINSLFLLLPRLQRRMSTITSRRNQKRCATPSSPSYTRGGCREGCLEECLVASLVELEAAPPQDQLLRRSTEHCRQCLYLRSQHTLLFTQPEYTFNKHQATGLFCLQLNSCHNLCLQHLINLSN